jgi:hypothetical protein
MGLFPKVARTGELGAQKGLNGPKPDHHNMHVVSGLYAPCAAERSSFLLDKWENNQLQPDGF